MEDYNNKLKLPLDESVKFNFRDLQDLLDRLLSEDGGCEWDKEQTIESLKKYMLEECYEVLEAVDSGISENISEELGDVLYQVFFMSKLCQLENRFTIDDVVDKVCRKMISRHTHIFGGDSFSSSTDIEKIWEKNKAREKVYKSLFDKLNQIPNNLPALVKAEKAIEKSEESGLIELSESINNTKKLLEDIGNCQENKKMEIIGEILLQISVISYRMQINAEFALTNAVKTYINKFEHIEEPRQI